MREIMRPMAAGLTLTVTLGVAGCSNFEANTMNNDGAAIEHCYDQPLPTEIVPTKKIAAPKVPSPKDFKSVGAFLEASKQWQKKEDAWVNSTDPYYLPPLKEPTILKDSFIANDPIYNGTIVDKTLSSTVLITDGEYQGTGFITKDPEGDDVVVTAGHVTAGDHTGDLTVTLDDGTTRKVTEGCYIYEDKGKFKKLSNIEEGVVEHDIAVLVLKGHLGAEPLNISKTNSKRGQWDYFVNYQQNYMLGGPSFYSGLTLSSPENLQGYTWETGLERMKTPVTNGEFMSSEMQPGASGGPIVDAKTGKVVGISTGTLRDGLYDDPTTLKDMYNVTFPGAKFGNKNGRLPMPAYAMSTWLIRKVLAAPLLEQPVSTPAVAKKP